MKRLQDISAQLSPTQVTSIKILLDKTLPVLSAQEVTGGVTNFVARLPEVANTIDDWKASLEAPVSSTLADKIKH